MATAEAALAALESIARDMRILVAHFGAETRPLAANASTGPAKGTVASDRDLDGQYGNPEVRTKDPRDWTGETMRGKRFSECPIEYLDQYAPFLDWMAGQSQAQADDPAASSEDVKKALTVVRYKLLDAARARGWAARLRSGWKAPASDAGFGTVASGEPLTDDQIPF